MDCSDCSQASDLAVSGSRVVDIGAVAHDVLGGGRGHQGQERGRQAYAKHRLRRLRREAAMYFSDSKWGMIKVDNRPNKMKIYFVIDMRYRHVGIRNVHIFQVQIYKYNSSQCSYKVKPIFPTMMLMYIDLFLTLVKNNEKLINIQCKNTYLLKQMSHVNFPGQGQSMFSVNDFSYFFLDE